MSSKSIAIGMASILVLCAAMGAVVLMNNNGNNDVANDTIDIVLDASSSKLKEKNMLSPSSELGVDAYDLEFAGSVLYDDELGWIIESANGEQTVLGHISFSELMEIVSGQGSAIIDGPTTVITTNN